MSVTPDSLNAAHYAAIIESSDDAILSKDRDAVIRSWNPGAERLYGWTAEEAIGRPVSILVPPSRHGEERRILDRILAGKRVDHYETQRVTKHGKLLWISLTISPVRDSTGEIVAASVIARDVTERRELEAERVRLLAESEAARASAEASRARLTLLAGASAILSESLDLTTCLVRLAELLAGELTERCSVHLATEGRLLEIAAIPDGEPARPQEPPALVVSAARHGGLEVHSIVSPELVWPGALPDEPGVSAVVAPIRSRGRVLGTLTLVEPGGREFESDEIRLIDEVARRAALAVENSLAYQAEHAVAVTLQRSLLPRELSRLPGVESAARYLPAATSVNVGGDWYDVIRLPGGGVAGAIGDVAGRGVPAAATMGQLRNAVRAYAFDGHAPASILERVNAFSQALDPPEMATIAVARLSPHGDRVDVVRAGHPAPIVRRPDGTVAALDGAAGMPVGVAAHVSYADATYEIEPGSTVFLYTDGLVERRGEALDEGLARLEQAIEAGPDDLEALCDWVVEQLVGEGAERRDDIALLALRVTAHDPARFSVRQAASPGSLALLRRALRGWLEGPDTHPQAVHDVITACGEAAANVIEHSYSGAEGMFEVRGTREPSGRVEVSVTDFGHWRPERETGGGRGLRVIRAMMDEVDVDAGEGGTTVTMWRHLSDEEPRHG